MNPKMFDKLTQEQKERVDPTRVKKSTDATVEFSAAKAKEVLGWKPEYTFDTMIDEMIERWYNVS